MDNEKNNNVENNTPSTDSDVMPSGGSTLGQAAKQGAKKTAQKGWKSFKEAVGRGIKALWQLLPMQVKIVVIVILFIFIILAALLMMGMIKESSSVVTSGVEDYISNANLDKDAKSLYEDKASLIKVKLKDINAMYDKFIDEEKGGAETQTLMKYKIGTKDVKEDNKEKRIVNVEDKLPLYKHILLTEKYNFNNVDWKKFSHNATAGEDIKDFKEDKERGLKYPDTTKNNAGDPKEVKLDKFIDLTLPYLQTWYIPLAMSNASVLNGTESDNNRAPAFSYNIIKEAYSNIVANWYELKKHTTVTRYYTYDEIKKHDMVTVEVIEREYENGAKNYSLRLGSSQTFEDSRTPKNTRTTSGIAGGTVDPMKEEAVSQKDEYTSHFYIKEADVFDAKIVNQFNYQVYSDSDAAKRRNADSTNESTATYAKTMSTEDINKKGENAMYGLTVDSNGNISGANLDKASRFGDGIPQNDPTNTTKRTTAYSYNVTFKQYTDYENGLEHTVTRIWKDKLSQTDSETSDYTIDDLIMYNQSDKRKEKVDATALCGEDYSASSSSGTSTGTKSGKYYTSLKKTDGLNRIDFMNSNPDIFHRYIREGGEYYEYVGYSREKLKLSYWNLKDLFQKVYDKNDSLPWAYGKTLGFENIYSSKSSSSSSSQGGMFIWPVPEYVEAGLSLKEQLRATFAGDDSVHNGNHGAIDIAHGVNTSAKIVAAAAGEVIKAGDTGDGYGNCVIIKHSNGYFTLYGHMAPGSLQVSEGDNVKQGQQIGTMGTTGKSTGNHLHFEVRTGASTFWASEKVDPEQFFNDDCSPIGGGSGAGNGEFLFTSGYKVDSSYKGCTYSLSSEERSEMQWIVYNEFGTGGYEGMVLQAQCLRDALVSKYNGCTPMTIKQTMGYEYSAYGNSKSVTDNSEDAKKAIEYVFDQGGSAVQHRILFMCPDWYYSPGSWHYDADGVTIQKVFSFKEKNGSTSVLFFDLL